MSVSNKQYNFQNINISKCIEKSFFEFLDENQIKYPSLSYKEMEKWNFEEYLDKNNILPLDLEKEPAIINFFPNISILKQNQNNNELRLVKFLGTIQNVFENQLYISAKYDLNDKKYIPNKYFENNSKIIKIDEDNAINRSNLDILGDRLRLELIPIIGLNEYFDEKYDIDGNKKILVYDYSNKYTKISQNILVIGVAYEKEEIIIIHSWKILENYEKIKICKDYKLYPNLEEQKRIYREKLKNIFLKILENDHLASDFLLLFLFSQIFAKKYTKNVGSFPLNLIINNDIKKCNDTFSNILNIFQQICLKVKDITLTIDELNKDIFYPKFDSEIEELKPGLLQLSDGTFLLLNEINMNEGKLLETGIKNLSALKNLIDFQLLQYEYPYNKIEINHDVEILIITHKTKSILSSPFLTLLPTIINNNNNNSDILTENDFKFIFYYLNFIRYDSSYNEKFTIKEEVSKVIQKNYVDNNRNFKEDDFDLVLKLTRFHALSYGRNYITYDDYEYALYLEKQRKERLEEYNKMKIKKEI